MEDQSAGGAEPYSFRDPTALTNWTRGVLFALVAVSLAWTWVDWTAYRALAHGAAAPDWTLWPLYRLPLDLTIAVLVLTWIYRANHNARALGASDMAFTPGWAIGWYFVPVVNLWRPFQAMREIWRASSAPEDWRRQPGSPLLGWWWALWILPFFVFDIVAWVAGYFEMVADPEVFDAALGVVAGLIDIPLALILITIIGRVHRMQMRHYRRQSAAG